MSEIKDESKLIKHRFGTPTKQLLFTMVQERNRVKAMEQSLISNTQTGTALPPFGVILLHYLAI